MRSIDVSKSSRPTAVAAGTAPMLQWLKIADLVVDDTYQRDLKRTNWTAIRRIADAFKWSRFSPVFVAPVEGGKYAVIDGQHRAHAAALCGFEEVPCQVVQMTVEEQAASFAAVNGLVTKVTTWNLFKAALAAGDGWAHECAAVCDRAGCVLMTNTGSTAAKEPGQIYTVMLIKKMVAAGKGTAVTMALKGIRNSEFGQGFEAYGNDILKPVLMAVCDRPWLVKTGADLAPFFNEFDIYKAIEQAVDFVKVKRRQGVADVSRYDIAAANIGEGLDRAFPQRMAAAA